MTETNTSQVAQLVKCISCEGEHYLVSTPTAFLDDLAAAGWALFEGDFHHVDCESHSDSVPELPDDVRKDPP